MNLVFSSQNADNVSRKSGFRDGFSFKGPGGQRELPHHPDSFGRSAGLQVSLRLLLAKLSYSEGATLFGMFRLLTRLKDLPHSTAGCHGIPEPVLTAGRDVRNARRPEEMLFRNPLWSAKLRLDWLDSTGLRWSTHPLYDL
jgi:hypothetical protein